MGVCKMWLVRSHSSTKSGPGRGVVWYIDNDNE